MLECLTMSCWNDTVSIWLICSSPVEMKLCVLPPTDPLCKSRSVLSLEKKLQTPEKRFGFRTTPPSVLVILCLCMWKTSLHTAIKIILRCIKEWSHQYASCQLNLYECFTSSSWPLNLNCWTITSPLDSVDFWDDREPESPKWRILL